MHHMPGEVTTKPAKEDCAKTFGVALASVARVDSETFELNNLDCLYIGRGEHEIVFSSEDAAHPAEFYLLSYPAHAEYPTRLSKRAELEPVSLGSLCTGA